MSNQYFSRILFGKEAASAHGTPVAADTKFYGQSQPHTQDRKPGFPDEQLGTRSKTQRVTESIYLVERSLVSDDGYFELLPVLHGCSLKGGVTAVEQTTSQGDYLWAMSPSFASGVANSPDSLTIEEGDDTQAWEAEYAMIRALHLSAQIPQAAEVAKVNVSADWFARQWTKTTFSSVSDAAVTPMNAKLARLYVDTAWAGVGVTEKANVLRGFTLDITSGLEPAFAGSANKYFNAHKESQLEAMLTVSLERGAISEALNDAMIARTLQVVRLEINGPQIGSGDTHKYAFDISGYWETVTLQDSADRGNYIDTLALRSVYDTTGAKAFAVNITTALAAY